MVETETKIQRYDSYKDSGVEWLGDIPEHWELTRLGTRFEERRTKVSDKDYPPLSVTKNGTVPQLSNAAKTNDGDNRKLVKKGDFVINSRSDRKGSSGIAYQDGSVSLINIVMEPLNIHPIYCNYLLKCYSFIEEFYRMGHGIVADLWTTRYDEMKAIMVGIPPLPEQTAIAQFLDDKTTKIDQAIAIKQQQIALLKERKQILIHKAVTKGVTSSAVEMKDSGVEWIGKIPEHWIMSKNGYISRIIRGASPRPAGHPMYFDGTDVPWLAVGDITKDENIYLNEAENFLTEAGKKQSRFIPKGTFILSNSGATLGVPKILNISGCINDGVLAFLNLNKSVINIIFLYYYFSSQTKRLRDEMNQGATQPNLNTDLVKDLPIALPPLSEQKEIAQYIEMASAKIETAISLKEKEISKLQEYKSSLINSVVTGKVRVC